MLEASLLLLLSSTTFEETTECFIGVERDIAQLENLLCQRFPHI